MQGVHFVCVSVCEFVCMGKGNNLFVFVFISERERESVRVRVSTTKFRSVPVRE